MRFLSRSEQSDARHKDVDAPLIEFPPRREKSGIAGERDPIGISGSGLQSTGRADRISGIEPENDAIFIQASPERPRKASTSWPLERTNSLTSPSSAP